MKQELITLVDPQGKPINTVEKLVGHHADTPLHLAFSCYVFNDQGKFLVTRRALGKKVWPGVWTNSVCGHPAPGEDMVDAIKRRLEYELGMTAADFDNLVPDYIYKTPPFKGIIEHEYCPIYIAYATSEPRPNPDEVADYKWLPWHEYVAAAEADTTDVYSWWGKDQLRLIKNHALIAKYSQPHVA